jgi:hypothetical protein
MRTLLFWEFLFRPGGKDGLVEKSVSWPCPKKMRGAAPSLFAGGHLKKVNRYSVVNLPAHSVRTGRGTFRSKNIGTLQGEVNTIFGLDWTGI